MNDIFAPNAAWERAVRAEARREYEREQREAALLAEVERLRAHVAELEVDLLKIEGFRADLADRCFRKDLELDAWRTGEHPEGTNEEGA